MKKISKHIKVFKKMDELISKMSYKYPKAKWHNNNHGGEFYHYDCPVCHFEMFYLVDYIKKR